MIRSHSKGRRALLALIGLAALPATPVPAQPAIRIEGGVPQRLPLTAIDDLQIAQPAQIDEDPVELAVLTLGAIDVQAPGGLGGDGSDRSQAQSIQAWAGRFGGTSEV